MKDRNLLVDWLQVSGPLDAAAEPNKQRERIMICDPQQIGEEACARQIFERFGRRALRRPLSEGELDRLLLLFAEAKMNGEGFDDGIKLGLARAAHLAPLHLPRRARSSASGSHPAPPQRLRARHPPLLLPVEQHARRRAARSGRDQGELSDSEAVLELQALRLLEDPRASRARSTTSPASGG
jgi:hypothetical protein